MGSGRARGAVLRLDRLLVAAHRRRCPPPALDAPQGDIQLVCGERRARRAPAGQGADAPGWPRRLRGAARRQDRDLQLPPELQQPIDESPAAAAFLAEATASYRKAAVSWVLSAKRAATREQRARQLADDSAAGRLIPPQRYGETPKWVERAAAAAQAAGSDPPR
ncbi:YdeI/OmpD-associated family protein [Agrococcus sp. Ld7]|uniref:YdeI/OmpD-associated family protein n=1 Tax=Agrococcus sp. Ld7 TaxID=649148 RepID=UPI00386C5FDA